MTAGPSLAQLMRRLADTPAPFQAPLEQLVVPAIVGDVLRDLGATPEPAALAALSERVRLASTGRKETTGQRDNRLQLTALACWLLADPWFRDKALGDAAHPLLGSGLAEMSRHVEAEKLLRDEARREELIRRCLAGLALRPAGESEAVAADRFKNVDSVERARVMAAARAAEARARKVREAMAKKKAQRSVPQYTAW